MEDFEARLRRLRRRDPRYPPIAYAFVLEALEHTIRSTGREGAKGEERHVSGRELLAGIRGYAAQEFGPLARAVLDSWSIRRTEDFGEIVFNLVEEKLLSRREEDSKADFAGGFDFGEAFGTEPRLEGDEAAG
ncbi:MAG TPA: Minf_1886 family protein [Planctomycetota bacterium]|nr:Minf_1886 family protein [Planctomycetota bacterium]